ncbi:VOC family protein [Pseudactinotalea terrae]|uniref:VOC family protein n=1 Tax=Pseudactinotalea terrae TaxID=1743262 RepID=UPI0012E2F1AB|nr:VOC family protein [Pseudactinotalea terrae]
MALRWYSTVIDSQDPSALARWWAEALDWQVIYEAEDEVVLIPGYVSSEEEVLAMEWERIPPGLVFVKVPEPKSVKNRLHIDLAPHTDDDRDAEIARLEKLGATREDVGQGAGVTWTVLADPEGNEFCVLSPRDA